MQQALLVLLAQLVLLERMVLPAHLAHQGPMEQTEQMVLLVPRVIKAYKD